MVSIGDEQKGWGLLHLQGSENCTIDFAGLAIAWPLYPVEFLSEQEGCMASAGMQLPHMPCIELRRLVKRELSRKQLGEACGHLDAGGSISSHPHHPFGS